MISRADLPKFVILHGDRQRCSIPEKYAEKVLEYEKRGLVRLIKSNDAIEVSYEKYIGCLPLGKQTFLIISPPGLSIDSSDDAIKFISLLLKYYGQRSSTDLAILPTGKSTALKAVDIIPLEELAESLARVLDTIADFPLRKIVRTKSVSSKIKGKIDVKSIFQALYLKPGMKLRSNSPAVTRNFNENRLIKTTVLSLLADNLFLSSSAEIKFEKVLELMKSVDAFGDGKRQAHTTNSTLPKLDLPVAICKTILTGRSFIGTRDLIEIEVPAYRTDFDFFEFMVRDAFKRILENAEKGSISVSSQSQLKFEPDLVIHATDARSFVVDMKFKTLEGGSHGSKNRSDIYQILAHSLSYPDANALGLIYPTRSVQNSGNEILRLDLIRPQKTIVAHWIDIPSLFKFVSLDSNGPEIEKTVLEFLALLEEEALKIEMQIAA